ncbi:MAG: hypothetical protein WCH46_10925 [bacterium]
MNIHQAHTYYVQGGLYELSRKMEEHFVNAGGEIRFKSLVKRIDFDEMQKIFTLTDSKGRTYQTKRVISNATIWDTLTLFGNVPKRLRRKIITASDRPQGTRWGALMLTGVVEDVLDDGGSLYHQFHTQEGSLFLSLSHRDDRIRSPEGWRTISVSSHEKNPERWLAMDNELYETEQLAALERFDHVLTKFLPGYRHAKKLSLEMGTPRTFSFYTHRTNGWVGGIAHSVKNWMPTWQSNVTPVHEFYLVGDTVFPGQGTPAVIQSAINLCDRIAPHKK